MTARLRRRRARLVRRLRGGRFMPEALVAALDELTVAWQEAMADPAFVAEFDAILREYAGMPEPALRRRAAQRAGRRPDPAQARGPQPHRRPQDPQRARPGAADQADGQDPGDRRDRRRPARRRQRHRGGVLRPRLHRLHGLGRHPAARRSTSPGCSCSAPRSCPVDSGSATLKDAINEALRDWVASVDHTAYLFGTAAGPHPFPSMVRDFTRGIGDEARAQCLEQYGVLPDAIAACVGGGSNAIGLFTGVPRRRRRRDLRLRGRRRRASRPAGTPRPSTPASAACCTAPAPTCSRTRTARPSSRTRSRPASTTRASGPQHAHLADDRPGDVPPGHRRRGDGRARAAQPAPRASSRRSSPRTRVAGALRRRRASWPPRGPDAIAGQPLRPRRQGHGHRDRVVRPRRRRGTEEPDRMTASADRAFDEGPRRRAAPRWSATCPAGFPDVDGGDRRRCARWSTPAAT